jgi:hypothetical protein
LTRKLLQSRKAATAVILAITLPVVIGGTALAVDVASFRLVHSRMQAAVDSAALAAVVQIDKKGPIKATAIDLVKDNVPSTFGDVTKTSDVTIGIYSKAGGFVPVAKDDDPNANAVRVIAMRAPARGNGVARMFSSLWGNDEITVSTSAIAARPANVFYEPPEGVVLDNSAHDFNEMYAYCFDYTKGGPAAGNRSDMKLIANNLGPGTDAIAYSYNFLKANPVTPMPWPDCKGEGLSLSFRLVNYRTAKNDRNQWKKAGGPTMFEYYSDTKIDKGVEQFNSAYDSILERYLCNTSADCDPSVKGSTVEKIFMKTGKNPQNKVNVPCEPGKFMYMGMEDRPPSGSSDRDYNDIAIRMKCPSSGKLADPYPRLVG